MGDQTFTLIFVSKVIFIARVSVHFSNISSLAKFALKGPKREKLHAMHVKELIKTNYFER